MAGAGGLPSLVLRHKRTKECLAFGYARGVEHIIHHISKTLFSWNIPILLRKLLRSMDKILRIMENIGGTIRSSALNFV